MPSPLPIFGDAEGPLGFPMPSAAAKQLEALMHKLPRDDAHAYRKLAMPAALTAMQPGERADVSWITAETPDREGDLVRADGMRDAEFDANPIVTLNHAYWLPPVGLSLWRRGVTEGGHRAVAAKTYYPPRPERWPDASWPPDECFALVQAGLMRGKSIGFLPLKVRPPTDDESRAGKVRHVVEKWLLLEYACCYLPVQQHAVVEAVGKGMTLSAPVQKAMGIDPPVASPAGDWIDVLSRVDWKAVATERLGAAIDRRRGRIV